MKINKNKLVIEKNVFDINLVFYNFLKKITQAKLTDRQIHDLLAIYYSNKEIELERLKELFYSYIDEKIKRDDLSAISNIIADINVAVIDVFIFSLKLNLIKDLLLQEAKLTTTIKTQELEGLHQLSLEYDKLSTQLAYATRINGALFSLFFFEELKAQNTNFISDSTTTFLENLSKSYRNLANKGVQPNQIFMLLFSESISQSILSSAGVKYEERIKAVLIGIGVPSESITKVHDKGDYSTEFDFFFNYHGRSYGISAKRTLRERYKQFIKTTQMSKLDVMIEITLGTDIRENIVDAIRTHGVYIFVADEIYNEKKYLQEREGVFSVKNLSIELLMKL